MDEEAQIEAVELVIDLMPAQTILKILQAELERLQKLQLMN
jgi:hypothetical protein